MDKTIKWIEKEFETLANAHDRIHSFVCDDFLSAYDSGKLNHVSMIVFASNSSASENNDLITFRIHVCDKVFDDQSNVQSVRSDTFAILRNIYNVVRHSRRWNSFSSVKSAAPFTYFRELGQDQVDGWFMDITLQVSDSHNLCAIPLDDYDFSTNYASACEPVTILIGGVFYTTAASGTTVNITSTGGDVIIKNTLEEIIATVAAPNRYTVADSTITVRNSNLTTLSTTSVPATNNETINVPDTPYTLKNSSGTNIGSGSFASGEAGIVISPDATVENSDASFAINAKSGITTILSDVTITATNSEATVVASTVSPSVKNVNLSIGDSNISNSDDSYSVNLAAEKALELPDVTVTIKNSATTTIATSTSPSVKNITATAPDTPIKNSAGTLQANAPSGADYTVADDTVRNSDSTYTTNVVQGVTKVLPDVTLTHKNSANTTIGTTTIPSVKNSNISIADTPIKNSAGTLQANAASGVDYTVPNDSVRNSDSTYTANDVVQGVTKVLPDVTMTKPNGTTESFPSVKNYTCTQIGALANADLISQLTDAQLTAVLAGRVQQRVVEYTSGSGTYTTPSDLIFAFVVCIGAGGGGGSGRRGAAGTNRCGGGGGANGTIARRWLTAAQLGASKSYAVGTGGTGGAAPTTDSTSGAVGSKGGDTSFGALVVAIGGNGGAAGGTSTTAAGGTATTISALTPSQFPLSHRNSAGATGAVAAGTAASTVGFDQIIGNNGAGGGGVATNNVNSGGGTGSVSIDRSGATNTGATAGTAGGGTGSNGTNNQSLQLHVDYVSGVPLNTVGFGTSGGGGGGNNATGGGAGGNGGNYGAAGSGAGGTTNGTTGGKGGDGAGGAIIIFEYYV